MALQSSQRLPVLQFYTKKSYRILQLQFYKGTPTQPPYTYPENSPSRIQFYMQKTKSSLSTTTTTTTYRGQKRPSFQKRNSTHRRQGDLLEIHPCVLQDLTKAFQTFQSFQTLQSFQTFQSFMTFQPIQAILQVPVPPGFPPHYSIFQSECIFYIFYKFFDWFPQKTPLSTRWTIQTFYKHYILQRKGDVAISVRIDRFSRIELFPSIVLSSEKANYKNDIQ